MRWLSLSPDLNPIQHLWDELDRLMRKRQPPPQTLRQPEQEIQQEWQRILQAKIQHMGESLPRPVTSVLHVNGGHNKYCHLNYVN